ncbi:transcription elongation factor [Algibacter sp.]|uniref:transcription elongation factor n=1 Tax=Algibacter sp. TaxID=1872428 RepID=UPI003C71DB04
MTTKQQLLQVCNERVDKRINDYKEEINLIKESIESNDKGDSDEDDAGNGKLQNDLEKNLEHLNDAQKTKEYLKQIKTNINFETAVLGSLVKTETMNFYLSTGIGKIVLDNVDYYAISLSSPIAQLLKNKTKNDRFEFNQTKYVIIDII